MAKKTEVKDASAETPKNPETTVAKFYGTAEGAAETIATRAGSAKSGLNVHAASDGDGCIQVRLFMWQGEARCVVRMVPWNGKGCDTLIYDGPISRFEPSLVRDLDASQKEEA